MFKVNNKDTRTSSSVSIVNFEHVIAGWEQFMNSAVFDRSVKRAQISLPLFTDF